MHPYKAKSHYVKYAGLFTSTYAIDTKSSCVLVSTVITNHFIGEDFYLSQHSMNGYEAIGFDVTQLTQDEEQCLLTIKTNMPLPMLVYGDSFQWTKYVHHILPSSLVLTSHNKAGLH
jgi:hypothetical protein